MATKTCNNVSCTQNNPQPVENFYKRSESADGLEYYCKICARARSIASRKLQASRHPLYNAWAGMKSRCSNLNHHQYADYGGRGIKVCDRWTTFENYEEDITKLLGPKLPGMSVDRIDNNGNYELSNVRWATKAEQQGNRRVCES